MRSPIQSKATMQLRVRMNQRFGLFKLRFQHACVPMLFGRVTSGTNCPHPAAIWFHGSQNRSVVRELKVRVQALFCSLQSCERSGPTRLPATGQSPSLRTIGCGGGFHSTIAPSISICLRPIAR